MPCVVAPFVAYVSVMADAYAAYRGLAVWAGSVSGAMVALYGSALKTLVLTVVVASAFVARDVVVIAGLLVGWSSPSLSLSVNGRGGGPTG